MIREFLLFVQSVSDFLWTFPTQYAWYSEIPVLGGFPFSALFLVGAGIFFTIRLRFIQVSHFRCGIRILTKKSSDGRGISPLASFFLSTAMRVGPGNILGVTGAISVGGPGALFWMWVSAFFAMATSYTESTLSQIFKQRKGNDFIGGFSYYGKVLLKGSAAVGVILSLLYIIYALLCLPAQGFNTISAVGQIAESLTEKTISSDSTLYIISSVVILILSAFIAFGGIRRTSRVTDILVPFMASVYLITVIFMILLNYQRIPYFFSVVFEGAFNPKALFGGTFATVLSQGVRRGLMSNEAGQGTITMAAATSRCSHPCEQGCVQSVGVFLDTMVICTLTAFVIIMGQVWNADMGQLEKFMASVTELSPHFSLLTSVTVSVCFGVFALTCLIGFLSFTEISAVRISDSPVFLTFVRVLALLVIAFGLLTNMVGLDLSALWNLSDFANILMVFINIPLLLIGFPIVRKATDNFRKGNRNFSGKVVGRELDSW